MKISSKDNILLVHKFRAILLKVWKYIFGRDNDFPFVITPIFYAFVTLLKRCIGFIINKHVNVLNNLKITEVSIIQIALIFIFLPIFLKLSQIITKLFTLS